MRLDDLDLALLSHTLQQMQVTTASVAVSLNIHKGKSKILKYSTENINLNTFGEVPEEVETFIYLSSIIDKQGGFDADVTVRIDKARTAFLQLEGIWNSRKLSAIIKVRIFSRNVRKVLLYGAQIWGTTITIIKVVQLSTQDTEYPLAEYHQQQLTEREQTSFQLR
ncbi:unnamed protein product [Schistosoma margrebowiei]|uniref:Uncharacterized protein n=1 Tax=Schistosoma margrebowiei TaxID=48269 RepID=A0A183LEV8_9TREM|nr:unnamed protein product [Schistosoma margrebowiei]